MKGKSILLFSVLSVILLCLTLLFVPAVSVLQTILCGITLMLLAIPCHFLGRKNKAFYILPFMLNTVGSGLAAKAYYFHNGIEIKLAELLLAFGAVIALILITFLILNIFEFSAAAAVTSIAITLILIIYSILIWISDNKCSGSILLFCLVLSLFYLIIYLISHNETKEEIPRQISYASFGAFVVIALVVIFVISEGDACDGCDGCDCSGEGGTKKKKK